MKVKLQAAAPSSGQSATYSFFEETAFDMKLLRLGLQGDVFERTTNDYSIRQRASRVFTDSKLGEGEQAYVRRTYAAFMSDFQVMNNREGTPKPFGNALGRSPLSGATIDIRGDAASGVEAAAFVDGSEAAKLESFATQPLPGLDAVTADLQFAGLLPEDGQAVELGTIWAVDPSALRAAISPGGDPPTYYGPVQNQIDPDFLALYGSHSVSCQLDAIDGEASAKLIGTTVQDGATLASIEITYDLTIERNPEDWMRTQCAPFEMAKAGRTAKSARQALKLKGSGTLLWDVAKGRMVTLKLDAESASDLAFEFQFNHMGMDFGGADHLKFGGRTSLTLEASYSE